MSENKMLAETRTEPAEPTGGCDGDSTDSLPTTPVAIGPTTRAVVTEGAIIRLAVYRDDELLGKIPLEPAEAAELAADLINAVRRRLG